MRPEAHRSDSSADRTLKKLLSLGEIDKTRSRDVTLPASRIAGYPFDNAEQAKAFHGALKLAEEAGAIGLEWRRHYENHELSRIRLVDVRRLADFMGEEYLPDRVDRLFEMLSIDELPGWCIDCLPPIKAAWRKGKSAYGMSLDESDRLAPLLLAVRVLADGPLPFTLDYRQFGARYLGDSKATKTIERPLAALFRQHWDAKAYSDRDIMQELNIVPLAHPVLMRGPFHIDVHPSSVSVQVSPYLGVPASWLEHVSATGTAAYVLTIENLSSFNEYTQSIQDSGVVLYTGGFPTKAFQRFYKQVVEEARAPVFHWGDTDPHGFLILKTLQQQIPGINLHPHLMDQPGGAAYNNVKLKELSRIVPVNAQVDELLSQLIDRGVGLVEQEEVRAVSPLANN